MWPEKLKLTKQLQRSVTDAGFLSPKQIQAKTLSRIVGGQDVIIVGPEGCGKTTAYVLGVLARLKYGFEEAPRALILVPDKERVEAVSAQFALLNKNESIRIVELYNTPGTETQMNALADGADIVIATPERARAIYLKLGLNLNKIMMFIVDDADQIVKQGLQLPVNELANSIIKCQHLVFTEVLHGKLEHMIEPFMQQPALIEIEENTEADIEVYPQQLYHLPNFRTKQNLLNLLLKNIDPDMKTVVFVNTRLTAEKVLNSLQHSVKAKTAVLNPIFFETKGFQHIEDFKDQDQIKTLIIADEQQGELDLFRIDTLIHFELPAEKETFIARTIKPAAESQRQYISFSTDIELTQIRKIENAIGQKMELLDLPIDLNIAKEQKDEPLKKQANHKKNIEPERGTAFHEKKESNKKDFNYSASTKAKMNKKKKHG